MILFATRAASGAKKARATLIQNLLAQKKFFSSKESTSYDGLLKRKRFILHLKVIQEKNHLLPK